VATLHYFLDFDEAVINQLEIFLAKIGTFIPKEALPYQDEALRNSISRTIQFFITSKRWFLAERRIHLDR